VLEDSVEMGFFAKLLNAIEMVNINEGKDAEEPLQDRA